MKWQPATTWTRSTADKAYFLERKAHRFWRAFYRGKKIGDARSMLGAQMLAEKHAERLDAKSRKRYRQATNSNQGADA